MSTIDQQFIEYIVKTIVGDPDAVSIKRTIDEKGVLLELTVDQQDLGRVIGKRGSGAQALRTLLRALGTKNDARYNLKIVDVGDDRPPRQNDDSQQDRQDVNDAPEESSQEPSEESELEESAQEDNEQQPEDQFAEESEEPQDSDDSEESSRAAKTRKELADLDDLDI